MGSIQIMQEPWGRVSQTDCCVGFLSGAFKGRDKWRKLYHAARCVCDGVMVRWNVVDVRRDCMLWGEKFHVQSDDDGFGT